MEIIRDLLLLGLIAAGGVWDVRTGRIPNALTYPGILLGLLGGWLGFGVPFRSCLLGFAVTFLPFLAAYALGWMGGGDVKLIGAVGALRGYPFALYAMFYAVFAGGLMALLLLLWKGRLGESLGDGFRYVGQLLRRGVKPEPLQRIGGSVPFGVAICFGTLVTIVLELRALAM